MDAARLSAAGALVALALLIGVPAGAQPPPKPLHVGYLAHAGPTSSNYQVFRTGLRELGWVEGQNLVIHYPSADGNVEKLPALAVEMVRQKVDVILATALAVEAASNATRTIPIVFVIGDDPVTTGLVANLGHPSGNVTGFTTLAAEVDAKRLALLKEAVPGLRRVAVLANPDLPGSDVALLAVERGAAALGLRLQTVPVRSIHEFDTAVSAASRADALLIIGSAFFFNHQPKLAGLTTRARLPTIVPWRQFVEAGGLMSYGADVSDLFRRAAGYVDRIAKGAKPGDLPVQQAAKFEMFINLKTAKALGLTIPRPVLLRADQILE